VDASVWKPVYGKKEGKEQETGNKKRAEKGQKRPGCGQARPVQQALIFF
jgi:hypothetical protein